MCDPLTLTIGAAAMTAASQITSGIATANADRFQAKIDQRNADMDRANAQDSLTRGRDLAHQQGVKTGQLIGSQRAAMAGNGIETDYGSGLALQQDTRAIGFKDQQTISQNAARESKGYEISAWNNLADASAKKSAAKAALWKTAFDVGGTVLSTAKQITAPSAPR